ncbi:hypothetical protein [Rhodanobacter koreensis]
MSDKRAGAANRPKRVMMRCGKLRAMQDCAMPGDELCIARHDANRDSPMMYITCSGASHKDFFDAKEHLHDNHTMWLHASSRDTAKGTQGTCSVQD